MTPWERFVARVGDVARAEPDAIEPGTLLVDDLGLDSLAMAELVAALSEDGMASFSDGLLAMDWEGMTVRGLFEACG